MKNSTIEQIELLNQQIKELVGLYRNAVTRSGVSENEFWIWYTLIVIGGDYSQQDIVSAWSLSKQTVNTIITHMIQKELIYLEVVPGTRNRKHIKMTPKGKEYGESLVLPISEAEQRTFEALPEHDRAELMRILASYTCLLRHELC